MNGKKTLLQDLLRLLRRAAENDYDDVHSTVDAPKFQLSNDLNLIREKATKGAYDNTAEDDPNINYLELLAEAGFKEEIN